MRTTLTAKLKAVMIAAALGWVCIPVRANIPERKGWWKFDYKPNLLLPETGTTATMALYGSHIAVEGPAVGNGAALLGSGSYYKMKHGIPPNNSGNKVNEYTLQYDIMIPEVSVWHCFFQTSLSNSDDGELFINPSGNIGVAAVGYAGYQVVAGEWYRLVISVKNGSQFNLYIDGSLLLKGKIQETDSRFSLDNALLIFADNDGEDGDIICSELAIWDSALTDTQIQQLGGFGHDPGPKVMTLVPFLQSPSSNSVTVSWHDKAETGTHADWSTDPGNLINTTQGTSQLVSDPYRWHTVKLTELLPDTRYFYRLGSGDSTSAVYSFRTLPAENYRGKLRFLVFGDTHASDTSMAGKILRKAGQKLKELYGPVIEDNVNGIFHTGDLVVSGNSPDQYTWQFFKPFSALSGNLPVMAVAGNHEGESRFFYDYMHLDEISAFPLNPDLNEKIWSLKTGNGLFIGMNTNISALYGHIQTQWLDSKLSEAEKDSTIDFVFIFFHHPPFSELWKTVNTFDLGSDYVKNSLLPVMKKYTKVQQIHYGHTHGFERGASIADNTGADIRTVCGGGGGGPLDPWNSTENIDIADIHTTISQYHFQVIELDVADHSYTTSVYSLGTPAHPKDAVCIDSWHKKKLQPGPDKPTAIKATLNGDNIEFVSSTISGPDSIMSTRLQVIDSTKTPAIVLDTLLNWRNIYGIDALENPVDLNRGINLYKIRIKNSLFSASVLYSFRIRYRDQNLKWSEWSTPLPFRNSGNTTGFNEKRNLYLEPVYPNPFTTSAIITYHIPAPTPITFRFFDSQVRLIDEINEGFKSQGTYRLLYIPPANAGNILICKMVTDYFVEDFKMMRIL